MGEVLNAVTGDMIAKCQMCGKEFNVRPFKVKRGGGKYCSNKCYGISKSGIGNHNYKKIKKVCPVCDKVFETIPSRVLKNRGKFCSQKCMGIWRSKNITGSKVYNWRGGKIKSHCLICGKEFLASAFEIGRGNGKFCSRKCNGMCNSKNNKGKDNPKWRGGVSSYVDLIRTSKQYANWRQKIFERDKFTCQKCGRIGGDIHAHHKKRFSVILDDIKQTFPLLSVVDIAANYPDLWDVENGITLCENCHKNEHKRK